MTDANPRTFDLFAPEESVIYPTEIVKVYRNRSALYELKKLEDTINDSLDPDAVAKLEGKVAEVRAVIERSALHVTLKGISTITSDAVFESVPKVNPEGKTEAEVAELEDASAGDEHLIVTPISGDGADDPRAVPAVMAPRSSLLADHLNEVALGEQAAQSVFCNHIRGFFYHGLPLGPFFA